MTALQLCRAAIAALFMAMLVSAGVVLAGDDNSCDQFPKEVTGKIAMGGWSGCGMKDWGEAPIWQQYEKKDAARVTRLAFHDGRTSGFRFVRIIEKKDGSGSMLTRDIGPEDHGFRGKMVQRDFRLRKLSSAQIAEINRLADASGTFDHVSGTWDGDEIYIHCDFLEMERIDGGGYRFSSVNISCAQPEKLMPFVNEVARLARIKPRDGGLNYVD